jgi:hypothetical protein
VSRVITLRGKSVEISDEGFDQLAHFGAELGLSMIHSLHNSEALQRPIAGHEPRFAAPEVDVAKRKATAAQRQHDVIRKMRESRGQAT